MWVGKREWRELLTTVVNAATGESQLQLYDNTTAVPSIQPLLQTSATRVYLRLPTHTQVKPLNQCQTQLSSFHTSTCTFRAKACVYMNTPTVYTYLVKMPLSASFSIYHIVNLALVATYHLVNLALVATMVYMQYTVT